MGRKSLAEQIWETHRETPPGDQTWLVIYDFQESKPPTKLYDNINRINNLAQDGQLIQYSVYMTRDQRAAKTIQDLVKHYDGSVMLFRGELIPE